MALPSIHIGLATLKVNPLRTLLSTLGVIIGAGSLVAVLSLGDGAESFARRALEREGFNHIVVEPITSDFVDRQTIPRASFPLFDSSTADEIAARLGARAVGSMVVQGPAWWTGAGPQTAGSSAQGHGQGHVQGQGQGKSQEQEQAQVQQDGRRAVSLTGLYPIGPSFGDDRAIAHGARLTADDARKDAAVAVISFALAQVLAGSRAPETALGQPLVLGSRTWRVIGIEERIAGDQGLRAFVPFASAEQAMVDTGRLRPRRILLQASRVEDVAPLSSIAREWAGGRAEWRDAVRVAPVRQQRLEQMERSILVFKLLMGAFSGISLVVGGIGIMNVLLASVAERTREIGIRKAVGARRRDVLVQFLTESVAIAGAGCGLGIVLGLSTAYGVTSLIRARTDMPIFAGASVSTVAISAAAAFLVGLVFGLYPALRAARLSPVDAIHRE
jgi:putative ABC transport system permease protein